MSELIVKIDEAVAKTVDLFIEQCEAIKRINSNLDPVEYCCGQFIGQNAHLIEQTGLHGLASAIRTLSTSTDPRSHPILTGLLYTAKKYTAQPLSAQGHNGVGKTIKISELLFSLKKVASPSSDKDDAIGRLETILRNSKQTNPIGWPYIVDELQPQSGTPQFLPTVAAFQALWDSGNPADTSDILKKLEDKATVYINGKTREKDIDLYVAIYCLYVITFRTSSLTKAEENKYNKIFKGLNTRLGSIALWSENEQNIEYWHDQRSYYVRVPWQLYMLALKSNFKASDIYSSRCKAKIEGICDRIKGEQFIYPFAGQLLSSRTHAIAAESLTIIKNNISALSLWNQLFYTIRGWLGHRIAKIIISLLIFGVILAIYCIALKKQGLNIISLVGDLNASALCFLATWGWGVFKGTVSRED